MTITIKAATSPEERCSHIRSATLRCLPQLVECPKRKDPMVLACYGPSLLDTWENLRGREVFTVSGAHDFLIERGIVPVAHIDSETRAHKAAMITPRDGITYLLASCCHPAMFDKLYGYDVWTWHNEGSAEETACIKRLDPDGFLVLGGSTTGVRSLCVGTVLGYRKFEIHGMDCSFREGQHAGAHARPEEMVISVRQPEVDPDVAWSTSMQMVLQVQDFLAFAGKGYPIRLYGEGLLQAICQKTRIENVDVVESDRPRILRAA